MKTASEIISDWKVWSRFW